MSPGPGHSPGGEPGPAWALRPLAWLWGLGSAGLRRWHGAGEKAPVPVVVVGNLVVGGTGKTPVAMALIQALLQKGHRPGLISRGYGRRGRQVQEVQAFCDAREVGDEPLLIHLRTGVPCFVGAHRLEAARALCAQYPQVDVLVSDDGLQHHRLAHQAALVLFDARGLGNGRLLPAGPLRQHPPQPWPAHWQVLYSGCPPSTPLPGPVAHRRVSVALPFHQWAAADHSGAQALGQLAQAQKTEGQADGQIEPWHAVAGIGVPERFFEALRAHGLHILPLPQADHADYSAQAPWPQQARRVLVTEKDAVKLRHLRPEAMGPLELWVVPLDCQLPPDVPDFVLHHLRLAPPPAGPLPLPRPLADLNP